MREAGASATPSLIFAVSCDQGYVVDMETNGCARGHDAFVNAGAEHPVYKGTPEITMYNKQRAAEEATMSAHPSFRIH